MIYQKPTNARELAEVIADLELELKFQKKEIEDTAALFMHNLKPINILKSVLQPVSNGFVGKWAGKLVLGYKKLLHKPVETKKPLLISHG